MKEKLSIIIVSWNTVDLLRACLKSIKEEVGRLKEIVVEVVVVDNASTDGSSEMVKKDFPRVKLIQNEKNLGFATAVNQGLRQTQGEARLLLNSDTRLTKGSLGKLLEFEKEVGPAIIGARLINPDSSVQPSVFHLPSIKRAVLEYWLGKKGYFSKYAPAGSESQEVEAVSGGAMLISWKIIEKIGLLDERYFMYFEDLDYCRRARKAGFKVYYLPTAEIIHEHGASGRKLAAVEEQWRRLVPGSKIYNGVLAHYLITGIIWSGEKLRKLFFKAGT